MCDRHTFMTHAIDLSRKHMLGGEGGPFGAVIVRDGKVIAEGWNQVTSLNDPTAHAEVQAIRTACAELGSFDLSGCEIYASCEPCPMCLSAIYWARIGKLYYGATAADAAGGGFDDAFIYEQFALPPEKRSVKTERLEGEAAARVFDEWSRKADKVPY